MSEAIESIIPRTGPGGARANPEGSGQPEKVSAPSAPPRDIDRWYCLRTEFGQERRADIAVRLDGGTAFNPSIYRPATPARRDAGGIIRPGKSIRFELLFQRYIFVRLNLSEPYWYQVKRLPGVERIISGVNLTGGPGMPIAVPDSAIDWVRGLAGFAQSDCLYPLNNRDTRIEAGISVTEPRGPLTGYGGVCTWSEGKRVRMLMRLMGRDIRAVVAA